MNKYNNSIIYKIFSPSTDEVYVGSSVRTKEERFYKHKYDYKNYKLKKRRYCSSFEILKYDDCEINVLENFSCNNVKELHKREGYYQNEIKCVNKYIMSRTPEQYKIFYEKVLERAKEKSRIWRINNYKKMKVYNKIYNERMKARPVINCQCGGKYQDIKEVKKRHYMTKKHKKYFNL